MGAKGRSARPLWTCPRCGARLVTQNGWHSCGQATLAEWRVKMSPRMRRLVTRFEAAIASCGPFDVAAAKTRIAYMARVRFATITSVARGALTLTFALPTPVRSARFLRVYEAVPGWWVHVVRVTRETEFDAQLRRWLRRSYRLMGMQERLRRKAR